MISSGCAFAGAASSPGLALICSTVPEMGARIVKRSMAAAAAAASARVTLTWPSTKFGSGVPGSASMRRSSALCWRWRSCARAKPARAASSVASEAAPVRRSTAA